MDQEAVGVVRWDRITQLLDRPLSGWMCGQVGMEDASGRRVNGHRYIEQAKGRCHYDAEVACDDRFGMVAHKGQPALRRDTARSSAVQPLRQVLAHGARRDAQA